jgi:tetratricopeptide (TPR) repeat protein
VLITALAANLVLLAGAFLLRRWDGRVAFGIFWFFLFILPTSGVAPAALLMHEHWAYLPSFGLMLSALALLRRASAPAAQGRAGRIPAAVLLLICPVLAFVTFERNKTWQQPVALWRDASLHAPQKSRVWNNLGAALIEQEKYGPALKALLRAENQGEPTSASRYNIGLCYLETRNLKKAETYLEEAARMSPDRPEIQVALGRLSRLKGKLRRSVEHYSAALEHSFYTPELILDLADVYMRMDQPNRAREIIRKGRGIFPENDEIREAETRLGEQNP